MPAGIIATIGNKQYQIGGPSNVEKQEFDAIFRLYAAFDIDNSQTESSGDENDLPELLNLDTNLSVVTGNLDDCMNKLNNGEIINAVFYIDTFFYRYDVVGALRQIRFNLPCWAVYAQNEQNEIGLRILFTSTSIQPGVSTALSFYIDWFPNGSVTAYRDGDIVDEALTDLYESGFFGPGSIQLY